MSKRTAVEKNKQNKSIVSWNIDKLRGTGEQDESGWEVINGFTLTKEIVVRLSRTEALRHQKELMEFMSWAEHPQAWLNAFCAKMEKKVSASTR